MKEQYVGDVSDYRKYALLRRLSAGGRVRIGVCWMLTPSDGRNDGSKTDYLKQPERWRHYDPALFDTLVATLSADGGRTLKRIEASDAIPNAAYFSEDVPDGIAGRSAYFARAKGRLKDVDLVFFDPDNGVDIVSKPKGRKNSSKFIYRDEIAATYEAGHSLLIYQHFCREAREAFIKRLGADLKQCAPTSRLWVYLTAHVVFVLVIHPRHETTLGAAAEAATAGWTAEFMTAKKI